MEDILDQTDLNTNRSCDNLYVQRSTPTSSTSDGMSGDETSDTSLTIPISLVGAMNYLTVTEGCQSALSVVELREAVDRCKALVLESTECSDERKWLVRRLIELRYKLQQTMEAEEENMTGSLEKDSIQVLCGHHFKLKYQTASMTKLRRCDLCCSAIWSVVHTWYRCSDCQYKCHFKCLEQTQRVCANVKASERPEYESRICPEVGLDAQGYRCAECRAAINFKDSWIEARLCDYDGRYYCASCHWNNTTFMPARIVQNWEFEMQPVCRASYQLLRLTQSHPLLQPEPQLFLLVEELAQVKVLPNICQEEWVTDPYIELSDPRSPPRPQFAIATVPAVLETKYLQKMREDLLLFKEYLVACDEAVKQKLLWKHFKQHHHFLKDALFYSFKDLIEIKNGTLVDYLKSKMEIFVKHIKLHCAMCKARGYRCELCNDKTVLFPFDPAVNRCDKCLSVYHRACSIKNEECPKCLRMNQRNAAKSMTSDEEERCGETADLIT